MGPCESLSNKEFMKIELWKSKLHSGKMLNYFLAAVCAGLVMALIANGLLRSNVIFHVAPMQIEKGYWASATEGSDQYRKAIALSLLPWVANVTPASVDYTHKLFLDYVPPDVNGLMSESLGAEALYIKNNNLNRVFYPNATRVNGDEVIIQGLERRFVGKTETQEEEREYHLALKFVDWKPYVVGVRAVHLDRTNGADTKSGKHETNRNG